MNDGHDPLYALRSYDCPLSRASRDKWLAHRIASGMPVTQHLDRFTEVPQVFARQFERSRSIADKQVGTKAPKVL